ncbi:hypothetical protein Peur_011470 [Populus x canadensis]
MENTKPYVQEINVDPSNDPQMNNVVLPSANDVVAPIKTKHVSATLANTIVTKILEPNKTEARRNSYFNSKPPQSFPRVISIRKVALISRLARSGVAASPFSVLRSRIESISS